MDSEKLAKLIESVGNKPRTKLELLTQYRNVVDCNGPRELLEAIEERLRRDFPRAANAAFGQISEEAMDILGKVAEKLSAQFDLSSNTVLSHVKVGGYEQTGQQLICRYISYKNRENMGVQLTLSQQELASEMVATVSTYRTNAKIDNFRNEKVYSMGELDQAVEHYRQHLLALGATTRV